MIGPDRVPVAKPFRIVPHAVAIDDMPACRNRNIDAAPIHMGGNAQHHVFRRIAKPFARPCAAHPFGIATNAARGDDDVTR